MEAIKIAIWCLYLGAVVAYVLGQTARILVQHWVDAEVARALAPSEPVEALPCLSETFATAETPGTDLVLTEPDWQDTQGMAMEDVAPLDYRTLTTAQLRRECTAAGIR